MYLSPDMFPDQHRGPEARPLPMDHTFAPGIFPMGLSDVANMYPVVRIAIDSLFRRKGHNASKAALQGVWIR